jgi:hypothetical protein
MANYLEIYEKLAYKAFIIETMSEITVKGLKAKEEARKEFEKEILKEGKDKEGFVPLKTMSLSVKGKVMKLVKGLPVPKEYNEFINMMKKDKQKLYFK